jgi:hypothetical protein
MHCTNYIWCYLWMTWTAREDRSPTTVHALTAEGSMLCRDARSEIARNYNQQKRVSTLEDSQHTQETEAR